MDYVFIRGFSVEQLSVGVQYASVTSHRPLFVKLSHPSASPTSDMPLQQAMGAAYIRSAAKLRELLKGLAADDASSLDLPPAKVQSIYD
jgi:hypothetical protein